VEKHKTRYRPKEVVYHHISVFLPYSAAFLMSPQ